MMSILILFFIFSMLILVWHYITRKKVVLHHIKVANYLKIKIESEQQKSRLLNNDLLNEHHFGTDYKIAILKQQVHILELIAS